MSTELRRDKLGSIFSSTVKSLFFENTEDAMDTTSGSVGVIIGRFQVPRLRKGHRALIEFVLGQNDETLVILGESEFPTSRNPLSYEMRKAMFAASFPDIRIDRLLDHPSDEAWIRNLEDVIASRYPSSQVTLYGSRDSFLGMYTGRYATQFVQPADCESGTEHRRKVGMSASTYEGFRRGIIHTYERLVPTVHATVDIAIIRQLHGKTQVLLGRKRTEGQAWRFIGGRVDPSDPSAEHAARRELSEEAGGFEVSDLRFVGTSKIPDWRYCGSKDGVLTTFFRATYVFGLIEARDDIHELKWFDADQVLNLVIKDHLGLAKMLLESLAADERLPSHLTA